MLYASIWLESLIEYNCDVSIISRSSSCAANLKKTVETLIDPDYLNPRILISIIVPVKGILALTLRS
jgi:hypothetical protein